MRRVLGMIAVVALGPACDSERPRGDGPDAGALVDAVVGTAMAQIPATGGVIAVDGFTLTIPPGALLQATVLTIAKTDEVPPSIFDRDISAVYTIAPADLRLLAPVRVNVQITTQTQHPSLWLHAPDGYVPIDSDYDAGHVTADLSQFGAIFVGRGPAAMSVSPSHFDAGPIDLGHKRDFTIAVSNRGGMTAQNVECRVGGPNATDVQARSGSCTVISGDQLCNFNYSVEAKGLGPREATIVCRSDTASPVSARITATGEPGLDTVIAPHAVDFGPLPVGTASELRGVTLTNTLPMRIGTPTVVLASAGNPEGIDAFTIALTTCTSTLEPGERCTVYISARPTRAFMQSVILRFAASPGGTGSVYLQVEGFAPPP